MPLLSKGSTFWNYLCLSSLALVQQWIVSCLSEKYILNLIISLIFLYYSIGRVQNFWVVCDASFILRSHNATITKSYWLYLQNILQISHLPNSTTHKLIQGNVPLPWTTSIVSSLWFLYFLPMIFKTLIRLMADCSWNASVHFHHACRTPDTIKDRHALYMKSSLLPLWLCLLKLLFCAHCSSYTGLDCFSHTQLCSHFTTFTLTLLPS